MQRLRKAWPIVGAVILATLVTGRLAVAQVPILNPAFEPLPRGSAVINGTVVAAESGLPLRRAALILTLLSAPPGRDGAQPSIVVLTDERGRYAFRQLPRGRYNVTASKTSRVAVAWGQRRPADAGTALDVADGQVIQDVDLSLVKGGVIAVHVTDDGGEPIAGVGLEVYAFKYVNGRRVPALVPGVRGATNAAGNRRLSGLGTGDYLVRATTDPRGGTTVRVPVPSGQFFVITPPGAVVSILNAPASNIGSSFYPGTALLSEAQRVHVTEGGETAIAFPIGPRLQPSIRGTVTRSDGAATDSTTIRVPASLGESARPPIVVQPDGSFYAGMPAPGEYVLIVSSRPGTPEAEHAIVPIRLAADLNDLAIRTRPAGTVHGRIVFDEGDPPATLKPWDVQMVALGLDNQAANRSAAFSMHADWTFDLTGLEGPVTLALAGGAAGAWSLRSITINDQDVLDWLVDVDGRDVRDAVVTLTRRTGTITGTVTASQGTALANCPIVVFSADPRRWTPFSRSIIATSTDAQGRFTIAGLLPGRYFAAAATDLETGAERSPDALTAIANSAAGIVVVAGESASIALRVSR